MVRVLVSALILVAGVTAPITAAGAGSARRERVAVPIKDCTRLNGRYGYYGNPWCTPAEQLRWDRWDARRR